MDIRTIPIDQINPAPYNPRIDLKPGDVDYDNLKKAISEFDVVEPLVMNMRGNVLIGGHQRLKVLKELGYTSVDVSVVDLPEDKEKTLNLALNKISGDWDTVLLKDILQELDVGSVDMSLTGFSMEEIENLMTQEHQDGEGLTDDDEVPEVKESIVKTGDLWILGSHRLLCGDATNADDHDRLIGTDKIDLVLTDPPYGVGIEYGVGVDVKQTFDDSRDYVISLIPKFMPLLLKWPVVLLTPGQYMMWHYPTPKWTLAWVIPAGGGMNPWGFTTWHAVLAYGGDPYLHESLGGRPDGVTMLATRDADVKGHPVAKPEKVWEWFLERGSTHVGQNVLDTFGGSGTTMIACEKLGRRCFMMEISPEYCDVILARWEAWTGKKAEQVVA